MKIFLLFISLIISYYATDFFFSKTNSYAHIYGQVAITPLGTKKALECITNGIVHKDIYI